MASTEAFTLSVKPQTSGKTSEFVAVKLEDAKRAAPKASPSSSNEPSGQIVSRRGLLKWLGGRHGAPQSDTRGVTGATLAASLGMSAGMGMLMSQAHAAPPMSGMGDPDKSALLTKLVQRCTFGVSATEMNLVRSMGYDGYLDYQLNPDMIQDTAVEARLAPLTTLAGIYADIKQLPSTQVINELIEGTIIRATYSNRQLYERMVEFWSDHFNISVEKLNCAWLKAVEDRDTIRPNVLGYFSDLLAGSATSSAMMVYLDNHISVPHAPNQNYAREIMELHTMGSYNGYTEGDVVEVARCFTGWQVYPDNSPYPLAGTFRYNPSQHDNGQKTVLGHVIPAGGGIQDGLTVLQILSEHPNTARYISNKLCERFLDYSPSQGVVTAATATFTATGGNIREVMRTILSSQHVADARPKLKRPFHAFVSALRASNAEMIASGSFRNQLRSAGHLLFYWVPPDGFPDKIDFWSGFLLPRWNFGAMLMNGNLSGLSVDATAFFTGCSDATEMIQRINANMFGGEMSQEEKTRIHEFLLPDPPNLSRQKEAMGLAIGSPTFQMY